MTGKDYLEQALSRQPRAKKLFEAMAPSHQREYIQWIDEAKLSVTKSRRAEQALEQIVAKDKQKTDTGYSDTPLAKKLGIGPGINIIIHAPTGYEALLDVNKKIVLLKRIQPAANFIQAFYSERRRLENDFETLARNLRKDGCLWISWPKGTSKMETDLTENIVRAVGLTHGLVDVKVAAIDADWSGLKFVYRLKDR